MRSIAIPVTLLGGTIALVAWVAERRLIDR